MYLVNGGIPRDAHEHLLDKRIHMCAYTSHNTLCMQCACASVKVMESDTIIKLLDKS